MDAELQKKKNTRKPTVKRFAALLGIFGAQADQVKARTSDTQTAALTYSGHATCAAKQNN